MIAGLWLMISLWLEEYRGIYSCGKELNEKKNEDTKVKRIDSKAYWWQCDRLADQEKEYSLTRDWRIAFDGYCLLAWSPCENYAEFISELILFAVVVLCPFAVSRPSASSSALAMLFNSSSEKELLQFCFILLLYRFRHQVINFPSTILLNYFCFLFFLFMTLFTCVCVCVGI